MSEHSDTTDAQLTRIYRRVALFAVAAVLLFAGSFYMGASFASYAQDTQAAATLASLPSGGGAIDTRTDVAPASTITIPTPSEDPCEAPGVTCKYKRGTPEPASVCLNSQNIDIIAGCNVQRDIATRQVTAGVGREAPDITRIAYSSRECIIETSVGSGPCKRDARQSCPTALATPERTCFHTNCPGANSCVEANVQQPGGETPSEEPTLQDITEDMQEDAGAGAPGQKGGLEDVGAFGEGADMVPIETRYGTHEVPQSLIDDYQSVYGSEWRTQLEDQLVLGSQVADGSGSVMPDAVGAAQRHIDGRLGTGGGDGSTVVKPTPGDSGRRARAPKDSRGGPGGRETPGTDNPNVSAPRPDSPTPTPGGTPTPAPAPGPTTPAPGTPAPVGNPNPATPAPSGGGHVPGVTGGGVYENPGYDFGGSGGGGFGTDSRNPFGWQEPRYQSLQTPQERALRERLRSHFGGSREPSIVERFAQLIGADAGPVVRMSPEGQRIEGGQPQPTQPTQQRFIIRASDAHYRSIEQIARDVTRDDIPGDSRVDHYARTLRVVGGPNTNSRATTTNEAFASLQDLIVEDEAIRAMFVAEQTAEREKNRVFCVDGEESASCQARRTAVAERIERETFVAELQKRELPDNAVQHFLAVYDGWVRPDVPVPASNPLLLADAPASASLTPDAGARATATTTNEGFVSWAWGGVRNGAERMFEALRQWLTP